MKFKSLKDYTLYLQKWIETKVTVAKKDGIVIGVSGGIDSACVLAIAKKCKIKKVICYFFNIDNCKQDQQCIKLLGNKFKIKINEINLGKDYKKLVANLKISNELAKANIKSRLRMTGLYALANQNNCLVIGTSNAAEIYLGYFTKYGDGASDISPLAQLTKNEIYEISKSLNVPQEIIDRAPSAGLYEGQTDEKELGIKYSEIDSFLSSKHVSTKAKALIAKLHKQNLHKQKLIDSPESYK